MKIPQQRASRKRSSRDVVTPVQSPIDTGHDWPDEDSDLDPSYVPSDESDDDTDASSVYTESSADDE